MELKDGAHVHLMGICGTAMASLAGLFKKSGFRVTGSDQNVYPPMSTQLKDLGIDIMEGYKKENLSEKPDLVVVGNVITRKHEEAIALLESDIPYTSLPKAMGEFVIADKNSIVVSGTHGKTTTTSMMSVVADQCHKKPGFMIGGIPENYTNSFRKPEGDWFIIEGDEYDTAFFDKVPKFIYYRPKYVIFTSLEFDHADIYDSLDDIKASFKQLMELVPEDGIVVANADDQNVMEMLQYTKAKVVTYGLENGDYVARDRDVVSGRNQFAVVNNGRRVGDIAIKLFGPHNTLNALAAFALATELGWKPHEVMQGLASFKGVKRRQEIIGTPNDITVIEDFAHHPTAVNLTIQSVRERYKGQRVLAVFEPRSATSRRNVFQKDYAEALSKADIAVVAAPFNQANIAEEERFSSDQLVSDISELGGEAKIFTDVPDIVSFLSGEAKPTDVILIMSNGAFGGIYTDLLEQLSAN